MRIYPYPTSDDNIIEMNPTSYRDNSYNYNDKDNDNTENEQICCICLGAVSSDNLFLACNHLFHPPCIVRWFQRQKFNNAHPSCPFCKEIYNDTLFSNKILLYHIKYTETHIKKFKVILKNGLVSYIDRIRIRKLLQKYTNLNHILKSEKKTHSKCPYKSRYFNCDIIPLPNDIIQIISTIEKEKEKKKEEEEPDEKLLPKKQIYFCKNRIIYLINKFIKV